MATVPGNAGFQKSGAYLDPADYKEKIVLGTMAITDDVEEIIGSLLGGMGFGEGVGNWTPSLPEGSAEYPGTGDQENPGQNPGTGTGDENNSGNTGNNGAANSNGSEQNAAANAAAVQTGDTTNVLPYAVAILASLAIVAVVVFVVIKRRK